MKILLPGGSLPWRIVKTILSAKLLGLLGGIAGVLLAIAIVSALGLLK